jgi:plastocyanin
MMKTLLGACGLVVIASMSACSSDDDGTGTTTNDVVSVQVTSNAFTPGSTKIKVGQTVRWTWAGGSHNVVSGSNCTDDGKFKSGAPQAGGTYEKKFETAGTFPYFCEPHCAMNMTGEVVVE